MSSQKIAIEITALSPLHLGSGQADVNVDAEVIHDAYGMPYFPAKRFKGLLYESALEIVEMSELCGQDFITRQELEELFHRESDGKGVQLIVRDFFFAPQEEYSRFCAAWARLQSEYAALITPQDVLEIYTTLRYQTRLENGVAARGSLHNMRVVNEGIRFYGEIELIGEDVRKYLEVVALALRNMRYAGGKRNRGLGRISCRMQLANEGKSADRAANNAKQRNAGQGNTNQQKIKYRKDKKNTKNIQSANSGSGGAAHDLPREYKDDGQGLVKNRLKLGKGAK